MSLILDALKKVEREETAGKPGVVVVGSVPWGEPSRSPRRALLALGTVLALGLVALGAWRLLRPAGTGASRQSTQKTAVATPAEATPAGAVPPAVAPSPTALAPALVDARPDVPPAGSRSRPAAAKAPSAGPTPIVPQRPAAPSGDAGTAPPAAFGRPAAPDRPAPMPELRLSAISVRDGQPIAIVNDRVVREGDDFEGVRVVRIGEDEVEVEFRGRRHVLRF